MKSVLTLIAGPASGGLDHNIVSAAKAALHGAGARPGDVDWLGQDVACDLAFDNINHAAAIEAVVAAMDGKAIDVAALRAEGRRKQLLLADMDATIIHEESLDELAALAGVGAQVAEVTRRAMAGEIDFEEALRSRVALLAGQPAALVTATQSNLTPRAGARTLVQTMRAHGAVTVLVSGGFRVFVEPVALAMGFDHHEGNVLEIVDNIITGTVGDPVLGGPHKETVLRRLADENGVSMATTLAVGDGANDRYAIAAAGLGVALHGKPILKATADVSIDHGDLTSLLYIQGYRQADFVD
ncbi:MAG: phosphoserine phosphatase SerB [Alphaproteobacteria bacterium]